MAAKSKSPKRLSKGEDKTLFGVCSGIAHYLNVDTTVIRLLWIVATALTGFLPGILAYIIAAFVMPDA